MKTQKNSFENTARWARYGAWCFLVNALFLGFIFFFPFMTGAFKGLPADLVIFRLIIFIPWVILCVFFAWLTKVKVINPLQHGELPKHIRAWVLALSILGFPFGMMIGLVIMGYVDEKIKLLLKSFN